MAGKTFSGTLERMEGVGTWIYVEVPFDVEKAFDAAGQVKVKGTVNGAAFRSSLMPNGDGTHFLVVNKSLRDKARADVGAKVRVSVELDQAPRIIVAPPDLAKALTKNKTAQTAWEAFSFSHKKAYIDWIVEAKQDEARKRRIEKAVEKITAKEPLK
jgi:hypothetical protein